MEIVTDSVWRQIDKGSERRVKVLLAETLTVRIVGCDSDGNETGRPTRALRARFECAGYAGPGRRASGGYVPYQQETNQEPQ